MWKRAKVRRQGICLLLAGLAIRPLAAPALALEEAAADWDAIKACERRLCTMILEREPKGEDLSCPLAKTWAKSTLDGSESALVKWGFGDARCEVDLSLSRRDIVGALTQPSYSLEVPEHQVSCKVESGGETKDVRISLAPKLEFKGGRASKIWINLKDVSGPGSIKATVWTAANVQDTLGIFHKSMLKSVNKFMHKQCAERYGPGATVADEKRARIKSATAASTDQKDTLTAPPPPKESAPGGDAKTGALPMPAQESTDPAATSARPPIAGEHDGRTEGQPAPSVRILNADRDSRDAKSSPGAGPEPRPLASAPSKAVADTRAPPKSKDVAPGHTSGSRAAGKPAAPEPLDDDLDRAPWSVPAARP